jgi:general secretion pathway protein G
MNGRKKGFTILEILVVIMIIFILSALAQPIMADAARRAKEVELQYKLRAVRRAIDLFKRDWDRDGEKLYGELCVQNPLSCPQVSGENGYPRRLEDLLEVHFSGGGDETKKKYLRAVPVDPMTGTTEWNLRCYEDDPDAKSWCGEDVFDLHSESADRAIDGTYYKDW